MMKKNNDEKFNVDDQKKKILGETNSKNKKNDDKIPI